MLNFSNSRLGVEKHSRFNDPNGLSDQSSHNTGLNTGVSHCSHDLFIFAFIVLLPLFISIVNGEFTARKRKQWSSPDWVKIYRNLYTSLWTLNCYRFTWVPWRHPHTWAPGSQHWTCHHDLCENGRTLEPSLDEVQRVHHSCYVSGYEWGYSAFYRVHGALFIIHAQNTNLMFIIIMFEQFWTLELSLWGMKIFMKRINNWHSWMLARQHSKFFQLFTFEAK